MLLEICVFLRLLLYFLLHSLQMIGRKEGGKKKKKLESDILSSPDFLLCSNEAIDAPLCNKETFPSGSPVAVHTNEKSPSAWFCIPRVHFLQQATQRLLSLRCDSHVYAFVPHYSGPASADPHLAFKFPHQPASHAPMALAPLELYFSAALIQARLHAWCRLVREDCCVTPCCFSARGRQASHADVCSPASLKVISTHLRNAMQCKETMMAIIAVFKIVK